MAGKSVYLRNEELMLIHQVMREQIRELRHTPELERIRKEIESKMYAALIALETK
ncbi:hypothetical protein [Paenibacillus ehimensis]|uniref:hypothetical protein n=1 Tax=Paenibacillus ehimensis TaxID=79264 RepID=UPI000A4FA980|nr:hypothetical protein [Paenibacillus ehimensis]